MDPEQLMALTEGNPFFKFMKTEERRQLCSFNNAWQTYASGSHLIRAGDKDYGLFVLVKGSASVIKPKDIFLAQLKEGEIFGEISFKTHKPRFSSVIADEDCTVFKMDEAFLEKLGPDLQIKIKDQIIGVLISRLEDMNQRLIKLTRR